jgi:hypothetical protein
MTNYDAISARLYPYNVDDNLIAVACVDAGLVQEGEYSAEAKKNVAKAAIDVLRQLIVLASESNGGYSLVYDVNELRRRIHAIAKDNGFADIAEEFNARPTVKFL